MRPTLLLRIAAIVNLLFAAGHTIGFLSFRPTSVEGQAAAKALAVTFVEDGSRFSYMGFYKGFGLTCTLAMLLIAAWSWWLGELARSTPRATVPPLVMLLLYQLGSLVLAVLYFPLPAVLFSVLLPALYALALIGAMRAKQLSSSSRA
jgi:hypothetical protein